MAVNDILTDREQERLNAIDSRTREIGLGTKINSLSSTSASEGASLIGIQDSGSFYTGTSVEDALAELGGGVASAGSVGQVRHIKFTTSSGAAANTDQALPTGTWDVIDCWIVNQGAGEASDTCQLLDDSDNAITDAMDASGADHALVRCAVLNDANAEGLVGGTDALRATTVDNDSGGDLPAIDVHVLLRRVA